MSSLLAPRNLGYSVPGDVEAAVHAACYVLQNLDSNSAFLKLDFRNAFNSICQDQILTAVKELALYPMFYHVILHLLHCFGKTMSLSLKVYKVTPRTFLLSCYS